VACGTGLTPCALLGRTRTTGESPSRGQRHNAAAGRAGPELQRREDVVALQVRIVGEHFVDRHARRQQLEHALNGVAQPSDRRLAMADRGVGCDALEPGHVENDSSPEGGQRAVGPWHLVASRPSFEAYPRVSSGFLNLRARKSMSSQSRSPRGFAGLRGLVLEGLDRIDWASLTHAYGPANDAPDAIRGLASSEPEARKHALHSLYGNVFHQGTRYQASSHALPFVVELVCDTSIPDRQKLLRLLVHLAVGYQEGDLLRTGFDRASAKLEQDAWEPVRMAAVYTLAFLPDVASATWPLLYRVISEASDVRELANALLAYGLLASQYASDAFESRLVDSQSSSHLGRVRRRRTPPI